MKKVLTVLMLAGTVGAASILWFWCLGGAAPFALITRKSYMGKGVPKKSPTDADTG